MIFLFNIYRGDIKFINERFMKIETATSSHIKGLNTKNLLDMNGFLMFCMKIEKNIYVHVLHSLSQSPVSTGE